MLTLLEMFIHLGLGMPFCQHKVQ